MIQWQEEMDGDGCRWLASVVEAVVSESFFLAILKLEILDLEPGAILWVYLGRDAEHELNIIECQLPSVEAAKRHAEAILATLRQPLKDV